MDIKELMRTYLFLNDPNVRQVTTKFGALLIAIGAIAAVAWAGVNLAQDDAPAPGTQDPSAASADNGDYAHEECMEEHAFQTWLAEHPNVAESGTYEVQTVDTNILCVRW